MIIAIDGPAASGKSTTARLVALRLGFAYIDTGAMYRALVWFLQQQQLDPASSTDLEHIQTTFRYRMIPEAAGERHFVNDTDVTEVIRTPEITNRLNQITPLPQIRDFLVQLQRELASQGDVVLDGRDIGTVVCPQAELKIFLVASLEVRAARRAAEQRANGWEVDLVEIRNSISARDQADSSRRVGPLQRATDAVELDTSSLTINEQVDEIVSMASRLNGRSTT
ncbi:MAG: (d)CMP kinase [Candidatus Delongbacteria bacterium]|nr:(d)CMP kinase [Candidatus Delongbacteria bacterium]